VAEKDFPLAFEVSREIDFTLGSYSFERGCQIADARHWFVYVVV
jgi:hypothetical protein